MQSRETEYEAQTGAWTDGREAVCFRYASLAGELLSFVKVLVKVPADKSVEGEVGRVSRQEARTPSWTLPRRGRQWGFVSARVRDAAAAG